MKLELEVITVAIPPDPDSDSQGSSGPGRARLLVDSCRKNGLRLTVLGSGDRWGGYGTKLCLLRGHLRKHPKEKLVMFLDAFDTLLLPCGSRLIADFLAFGTPIVFGAEIGCWPDRHLRSRYPPSPTRAQRPGDARIAVLRPPPPFSSPFRFLNSGAFVGYAGAIREALEELDSRPDDDDQRLFTRYFLDHPERVSLDSGAVIFQNLFGVGPGDLVVERADPVRVKSRITLSEPCVLHGNGPGWSTFQEVARQLRELSWP
jgi:hypothetical protein